jgi:DNA-binding XRE family transcriptional regulator
MKTEIIERRGKPFAVVPLQTFEKLVHDSEMLVDIRANDAAKARDEETFPAEVAGRLVRGENPIRVFREHRGLTQQKLAKAVGIARPYLTELESGKKQASMAVMRTIAKALGVGLDDVAGYSVFDFLQGVGLRPIPTTVWVQ